MEQGQCSSEKSIVHTAVSHVHPLATSSSWRAAVTFQINDMSRRHIGHQYNGDHNLIRGKTEDKSEEDDTVQPHQMGEGVEEMGAVHQEAHSPDLDVGGEPDDKPCRGRDDDGAPQHKKCAIKNRADNYLDQSVGGGRAAALG